MLSFKKITGTERYRLSISDGMYSNGHAMLSPQINDMVTKKTLDEMCIISVTSYRCLRTPEQGSPKIIVILKAEVLRRGSQVGQKIGNPIAINLDGSVKDEDRKVRFEIVFIVILLGFI